ncbi:MAG TPA: hemerythrin domain-containing protein [Acidimicrobiia bacterium]|nr:hemerythrin domain-containing protein [Acidimicrobiia bacterium]
MSTTSDGAMDLISCVQRDHREIEQMLGRVERANGSERERAFRELTHELEAHEGAEQQVVHPLLGETGDEDEMDEFLDEEQSAKSVLTTLDVSAPNFDEEFAHFKQDVLTHAQHEEQEEHPRIEESESPEELERMGQRFEEMSARLKGSSA